MSANIFGSRFRLMTFGESHGPALGAVIDGCPAGVPWNGKILLDMLARRRPGHSEFVSQRKETDEPEILSGVYQGKTLGTPIAVIVRNQNARSGDYTQIEQQPRVGHADDLWREKFGHSDIRGGGRSSGRETVARVIGGAIAQMLMNKVGPEITLTAFALQIGPFDQLSASDIFRSDIVDLLTAARANGKSYGGKIRLQIRGLPRGLGQPVFRKFKSDLAAALMSIGATSSLEIGEGLVATQAEGSEFHSGKRPMVYGGLRGGLTTGELLEVSIGFKPTSSVLDIAKKGRHDPCIVLRAIPVVEAMAWLVVADHWLWSQTDQV